MKKYGLIVGSILMLSLALTGSSAAASEKTGFVNVQEVMVTTNVGKKEAEDLKKSVDKTKAIIQEKEAELKKLKDELEKQRPLLKEDVLKEKDTVFQKKLRDYQLFIKDSNEEIQMREQELRKKLIPEIVKVVKTLGEREKYTMIVDISLVPLIYYTKENDLTKRVVDEFNKSYKPKK